MVKEICYIIIYMFFRVIVSFVCIEFYMNIVNNAEKSKRTVRKFVRTVICVIILILYKKAPKPQFKRKQKGCPFLNSPVF